jgi:2-C-methyl-D-erythritol 4-phosphate cytidylyltransferase / 2-C-methyl-D-erythritol 2,4-cyclodiphosphate synthase
LALLSLSAKHMHNVAIIVAAGNGERAGAGLPKQFTRVNGKALVSHCVDAFAGHGGIDAIYVVVGFGQQPSLEEALENRTVKGIIIGGAERQLSVRAALDAIATAGGARTVLIHDAARPGLSSRVIDRLLDALETSQAAVPALPVVDTLARFNGADTSDRLGNTVDRSELIRIQTPQAFHFSAIVRAHQDWVGKSATDDAQMARAAGYSVALVEGDNMLDKITHPADFAAMEARLGSGRISRTGMGYDVHRIEHGKEMWLGGIQIQSDTGLSGHSDADVALHAITDALLGAIGDGDIGSHFPPSDPQWKGARSHRFVEHARDLINKRGGIIDHVDLTIICETPKIGPHRPAMRRTISEMLRVSEDQISIKATTTERLGFAGRGEGIAAQAVATVRI